MRTRARTHIHAGYEHCCSSSYIHRHAKLSLQDNYNATLSELIPHNYRTADREGWQRMTTMQQVPPDMHTCN